MACMVKVDYHGVLGDCQNPVTTRVVSPRAVCLDVCTIHATEKVSQGWTNIGPP